MHPTENGLSYCSFIFLQSKYKRPIGGSGESGESGRSGKSGGRAGGAGGESGKLHPYLIAGGDPEGISLRAGEFGCRMKSNKRSNTTVRGNSSTTPRGIVIVELPFSLIRRRRNASRGERRCFLDISSSCFFDGSRS
jgi:hypothetical protein